MYLLIRHSKLSNWFPGSFAHSVSAFVRCCFVNARICEKWKQCPLPRLYNIIIWQHSVNIERCPLRTPHSGLSIFFHLQVFWQMTIMLPVSEIWTKFYFLFQRSRKADPSSRVKAAALFISLTLCQLPHLCKRMFYSFISFRVLLCTCSTIKYPVICIWC